MPDRQHLPDPRAEAIEASVVVDDDTALVDPATFAALPEYSTTLPTGQRIGKRWKRNNGSFGRGPDDWQLGEYAELDPPEPERIAIVWRDLVVVT